MKRATSNMADRIKGFAHVWHNRPWSAAPKGAAVPAAWYVWRVKLTMVNGRWYAGQVRTARGYAVALDLFFWHVLGLLAGRQACREVESGEAEEETRCSAPADGREAVRILAYR